MWVQVSPNPWNALLFGNILQEKPKAREPCKKLFEIFFFYYWRWQMQKSEQNYLKNCLFVHIFSWKCNLKFNYFETFDIVMEFFCDVLNRKFFVFIWKKYLKVRNDLRLFVAVKCATSQKVCQEDQLVHSEVISKHNIKISLFRYIMRTFFDTIIWRVVIVAVA